MNYTIVYKTYKNDLNWLKYSDYRFIEGPNILSLRNQFWSRGGITEEIKNKIEEILK